MRIAGRVGTAHHQIRSYSLQSAAMHTWWAVPTLLWLLAGPASAQLPVARLSAAFPAGGNQGSTIEVTLNGTDLDGANQLYFTHAGITAKQVILDPTEFDPQPRPAEGKFSITIAGDVPPGMY